MSAPDRRPSRAAWITSALLAATATPWWGWHLGRPARPYWDEGFYLTDAHRFFRPDGLLTNPEHPPLGKWLFGLAITIAGDDAFGWRVTSLIASVLLVASLPLWLEPLGIVRASSPRWLLALPSCVLLVDPLVYSTARIAMLDAVLVLFYVSAALALVLSCTEGISPERARRARIAAGVLAGLALGTKWTALTLLPIFFVANVSLEAGHVRFRRRMLAELFAPCALVYLACFALPGATSFDLHAFPQTDGPLDPSLPWPARVAIVHARMVTYHTYYFRSDQSSRWYEWLIARQALDYTVRHEGQLVRVIAAIGSPVTWIVGELATLGVLVAAVRERHRATLLLVGFPLMQLAFWAVVLRMTLLYYMTAIVPFFALALTLAIAQRLDVATDRAKSLSRVSIAIAALLSLGVGWHVYVLPLVRGDALREEELTALARGPFGAFLFHDAMPVERVIDLARSDGFGAARLDP
ncbi:MAG: glycosyltransferase family 39 protein [Deltaproteobacteria bacterium]|nr:glycosyltransferase family 39 protein [Deltaproteobacteria bacterium]